MQKLYKIFIVIGFLTIVCGARASDLGQADFSTSIICGLVGLLLLVVGLKGTKIMN